MHLDREMKSLLIFILFPMFAAALQQQQAPLAPENHSLGDMGEKLDSSTSGALLDLHRKLVEIESITGNEKEVGKWLGSYLEKQNLTVELQEVGIDRFNVFAYPGKERKTDNLVTSHIDTVPPYLPYELKARSTEIWGRGTVDAKACVAAQTIAVVELLKSSSHHIRPGSVSLLFVVGEETNAAGMRYFSEHKPTNYSAVVFGEPTEGKLASGHKGLLNFNLQVRGKAAHSGYPWLGISANSVMVEALSKLVELEKTLPSSEKFGSSTLNIGLVNGGVASNVVAEEAKAGVAIRIAAGSPSTIKAMITEALASTKKWAESKGGHFEIEFIGRPYGPVDIDADVEGFDSMTVNYGTDIPNLDGDHKKYLYGPGSILVAHSDHEHLKVSELHQAVKDYQKLILAALKSR